MHVKILSNASSAWTEDALNKQSEQEDKVLTFASSLHTPVRQYTWSDKKLCCDETNEERAVYCGDDHVMFSLVFESISGVIICYLQASEHWLSWEYNTIVHGTCTSSCPIHDSPRRCDWHLYGASCLLDMTFLLLTCVDEDHNYVLPNYSGVQLKIFLSYDKICQGWLLMTQLTSCLAKHNEPNVVIPF